MELIDRYLAALVAGTPDAVPLAPEIQTVENLRQIRPQFTFPLEERGAEADESIPGVQLLLKFGKVADLVEEQGNAGTTSDPEAIRSAVLS